jgi:hypothetical protein
VQTLGFEQTNFTCRSIALGSFRYLLAVACAAIFVFSGCQKAIRTQDPQLKPIRQMLDEQLPPGTTEASVNEFLSARGYPSEPSGKPGTIVATIRHIDQERLQPVTARVTFFFDTSGKLSNYELQRTTNQPMPQ